MTKDEQDKTAKDWSFYHQVEPQPRVIESYVHAEPPPRPSPVPPVVDLVLADLSERVKNGQIKYGVLLTPHNGRRPLVDAYQEAIDLVFYLRQEIYERYRR